MPQKGSNRFYIMWGNRFVDLLQNARQNYNIQQSLMFWSESSCILRKELNSHNYFKCPWQYTWIMPGTFTKQCASTAADFQFERVDKSVNQKRVKSANTAVTKQFHFPKFSMSVINISHTATKTHNDYQHSWSVIIKQMPTI